MPRSPQRIPQRSLPALLLAALPACLLPLLAACAGTLTMPDRRPPDYAMVLTVYPDSAGTEGQTQTQTVAAFRPARYALEPDGLLRAEVGAGVTQPGYPPIARRLEPAQADTLYQLAHALNLTDAESEQASRAQRIPGPQVFDPAQATAGPDAPRRVAMIEIASLGTNRAFAIDATPTGDAAPLIRELERLTWLDQ